jgi:cytochrome c oxidase subunit 3
MNIVTTADGTLGPMANGQARPRLVVSRPRARRPPSEPLATPITNARIAVVMLLVAESMFFAGLIGAYLVFRGSSRVWPPPELPRLPLAVSWVNTVILMASGLAMLAAIRAVAAERREPLTRALGLTALLGAAFVTVQGAEWIRLVHYGLTLSTGTYGSTFYVLIGSHAVHVLGAMLWLGVVGAGVKRGWFGSRTYGVVEACGIYWFFVCALWLVLFALVYH